MGVTNAGSCCYYPKSQIPLSRPKRKCNRRYFSLKRYHKIKDTYAYKEYRKKYYKVWLDKNRDKFNASMRKASLKYQQKKKEEREKEKAQIQEQESKPIEKEGINNGIL